jgi:hypothetical protein
MSIAPTTDPSSIADHTQWCLRHFQTAQNSLACMAIEPKSVLELVSEAVDNELGRFRLWCGNIGAHRHGKSSLDHRLREASHIKSRVIELLQRIQILICDIDAIINGHKIPWDAEPGSDTDESDNESEVDKEGSTTELQQLVASTADVITNLMQLSSTIRNPASHDQFKRSGEIDTSYYEAFDIQHVKSKFPSAEQFLVTRMGRAISRRRQYLRYREEHRTRLGEGLDPTTALSREVEGTVASSIPAQLKAGSHTLELHDDDQFDDHASQTSYASSVNSSTTLRPPPLPQEGQDGRPFECPLCRYFTIIDQDIVWQKHVYRDLQPYVSLTS